MRKAKGKSSLIKKLLEIERTIILDIVIDNFNEYELNKRFEKLDKNLKYSDKLVFVAKEIMKENQKYLDKLIAFNNAYIEHNRYDKLSDNEYIIKCKDDKINSLAGEGIKAEQLILYVLTTGKLKEKLELFKKIYKEDLEEIETHKKDTLEKVPKLEGLLKGTQFELEFQMFVANDYAGIENVNFKSFEDKYKIKYDESSDTFKVPSGFVVFFDNKAEETFERMQDFNMYFGMLHKNLVDFNKRYEEDKKELEKAKGLIKENRQLENKNNFLRNKIRAYENEEQDDLVKEQRKEINYLHTQIEKLQSELKNIETDESIEVIEDIKIKEEKKEIVKHDITNKNIVIIFVKLNSKNREEVEEYVDSKQANVEFIEANKIFRNSEKIANKDIVIFDTSYNSHAGYYKIKSITKDILYINKSNITEIKNII